MKSTYCFKPLNGLEIKTNAGKVSLWQFGMLEDRV